MFLSVRFVKKVGGRFGPKGPVGRQREWSFGEDSEPPPTVM